MKKIVAIIAFMGILMQTFNQVVIVAEYYANKDYIAKNLCENRNKPQMHCDGKCCLKKKLANAGKEQAPANPNNQREEGVVLFFGHADYTLKQIFPIYEAIRYYEYNDMRTASYSTPVFHPPGATA